jgi:hypothetical protein
MEINLENMLKLMGVMERQEVLLNKQEDLLILEKEKNVELKKRLAKEVKKVEKLTNDLTLAEDSTLGLKKINLSLREDFNVLNAKYKAIEVQFETLWQSSSTSNDASCSNTTPTSDNCDRCNSIDIIACETNIVKVKKLEEELAKLKSTHQSRVNPKPKANHRFNPKGKMDKLGLGMKPNDVVPSKIEVINNRRVIPFESQRDGHKWTQVEGHAPQGTFDAHYVLKRDYYGYVYCKWVGPKNAKPKSCVWVPKMLVTNLRGPNKAWVPKNHK